MQDHQAVLVVDTKDQKPQLEEDELELLEPGAEQPLLREELRAARCRSRFLFESGGGGLLFVASWKLVFILENAFGLVVGNIPVSLQEHHSPIPLGLPIHTFSSGYKYETKEPRY